jgi:hypothetical protein
MGLRAVGLLEKSHPSTRGVSPAIPSTQSQARPMMDAVAISSSNKAKDT